MSTALVQIGKQELQQGGVGIDFASKLFRLKPATLSINQRMTQAEGAIPGKLRINETGDQFSDMTVVLLDMPTEQRAFYDGEPGKLNRSPENLRCFSWDMFRPDPKAPDPQALKCEGCPKASWEKWRQTKSPSDIPPCDAYYYAVLIDTEYKMPLQMFIRGASKAPFEAAMQNLSRTFAKMKSQGLKPNIFDISFKLSTAVGKNKTNYVLAVDGKSFKAIGDSEREAFGDAYLNFVNSRRKSPEQVQAQVIADTEGAIEGELVEPGTANAPAAPQGDGGVITI